MQALLTKIDPLKESYNRHYSYYRLYFRLEDGTFAMTDIVPTYRNYKYWQEILLKGPGTKIDNVFLKSKDKIDADSQVRIIQETLIPPKQSLL